MSACVPDRRGWWPKDWGHPLPLPQATKTDSMGATRKPTTTRKKSTRSLDKDEKEPRKGAPRPDEMSPDVLEFIHAIDLYKRVNQRPFPNWSEVLEILKGLGYSRAP